LKGTLSISRSFLFLFPFEDIKSGDDVMLYEARLIHYFSEISDQQLHTQSQISRLEKA
jgi:hypothetical protein